MIARGPKPRNPRNPRAPANPSCCSVFPHPPAPPGTSRPGSPREHPGGTSTPSSRPSRGRSRGRRSTARGLPAGDARPPRRDASPRSATRARGRAASRRRRRRRMDRRRRRDAPEEDGPAAARPRRPPPPPPQRSSAPQTLACMGRHAIVRVRGGTKLAPRRRDERRDPSRPDEPRRERLESSSGRLAARAGAEPLATTHAIAPERIGPLGGPRRVPRRPEELGEKRAGRLPRSAASRCFRPEARFAGENTRQRRQRRRVDVRAPRRAAAGSRAGSSFSAASSGRPRGRRGENRRGSPSPRPSRRGARRRGRTRRRTFRGSPRRRRPRESGVELPSNARGDGRRSVAGAAPRRTTTRALAHGGVREGDGAHGRGEGRGVARGLGGRRTMRQRGGGG